VGHIESPVERGHVYAVFLRAGFNQPGDPAVDFGGDFDLSRRFEFRFGNRNKTELRAFKAVRLYFSEQPVAAGSIEIRCANSDSHKKYPPLFSVNILLYIFYQYLYVLSRIFKKS
jgi:hypothetical protein